MNMKRTKTLLIMCGVLVILALAYLIIVTLTEKNNNNTPPDTDTPINTSYTAAKISISTLYSINYNLGDDKYSFSLNDTESAWLWDDSPELPLDNHFFASMASSLESVSSTVKLTGQQARLSEYGLDAPWLTVSVSDEVNGAQTFMFGSLNNFNGRYYFMNSAAPGVVYMVDSVVAHSFEYTPYEMVKHDTLPEILPENIRSVSFSSAGSERVYTCDPKEGGGIWHLSENGGEASALDAEMADSIPEAISAIAFTDIAGYSAADQKRLGLDAPTVMTVHYITETSVTNEGGSPVKVSVESTLTLNLGYADGNGKIYAGLPGSILSYRVEGTQLAELYSAITLPLSNG